MSSEVNYLEQKATPKILEIIAENDSEYTWYNVELRMNRLKGYPKSPPTFYIIKGLVNLGLIRELVSSEGSKNSKYKITQSGLKFLEKSKIEETS